ncbi:ABC transporter ATP-binding protein, partial [Clostridium perfringens]|nr:ABC transporter ATP-binding protein [Clostridium perfringens]
HIVADIESNCRRIAVKNKGRLSMNGSLAELKACWKGQVWEAVMSTDELDLIYPIYVVSTRTVPEGVLCRFIGQTAPVAGAFPADPTLEDVYLSLLRRDRHA